MRIVLLQHGEAVSGDNDAQNYLSVRGNEQARKAATFLKGLPIPFQSIIHSDKIRAVQTAEIIAKALGSVPLEQRSDIGPKDPIGPLLDFIHKSDQPFLIVGHFPFLRTLAFSILSLDGEQALFNFTNCSPLILKKENNAWLIELYAKNDLIP